MNEVTPFFDECQLAISFQAGKRPMLKASFPYSVNSRAISASGPGPRKYRIAPKAFDFVLKADPREFDVYFLKGHSYDFSFASRAAQTLRFKDTRDALFMEVDLPEPDNQPSWMIDSLKEIKNASVPLGVSPSFLVPGPSITNASRLETEAGTGSTIEVFTDVRLTEISIVNVPRFPMTSIMIENSLNAGTEGHEIYLEGWRRWR